MYNQPFLVPGYYGSVMPNVLRSSMGRTMIPNTLRGGLFSRLASAFGSIKNFNWSGIINNTSKTLGIINQGIPLVKQVGPMMNNMRSMIKIASIFKDETDNNNILNKKTNIKNNVNNNSSNVSNYDSSPTFFIN